MDAFVEAVRCAGLIGQVPYLEGAPGIGKTEVVKAIARDLGADLFVVCLAQRAGNEMHGIPVVGREPVRLGDRDYTVVQQAPPQYAIEAKNSKKSRAVIFFDEFNQLSPTDAGQAMTIFSERLIGEVRLPRNDVMMVAAGNPAHLAAGASPMTPPVRRRLMVLPMEVDAKAWAAPHAFPSNWGYELAPLNVFGGHPLPEDDRMRKRTLIASWVHSKPDVFVNKDVAKMREGYVCPATCEVAADVLAGVEAFVSKDHQALSRMMLLTSCLGPAGCQGLTTFLDNLDVPDPREVLDDPKKFFAQYPSKRMDHAKMYYFLMSLVEETRFRTKDHLKENRESLLKRAQKAWYNGLEVAGFLSENGAPADFLVLFIGNMQSEGTIPKKVDVSLCPVIEKFTPMIATMRAAGVNWVKLAGSLPESDAKKKK